MASYTFKKWIPVSPFLCISLSLSQTHKEKDLEKEKIKTAPIWFIYHLSFSITLQNWAKCSLLYSFPSFSPYSLIHAGLETKWVCKKAVHYFPLHDFPFQWLHGCCQLTGAIKDALLWLHGELWTLCVRCLTGEKWRVYQTLLLLPSCHQVAKANMFCQIAQKFIREEKTNGFMASELIQYAHLIYEMFNFCIWLFDFRNTCLYGCNLLLPPHLYLCICICVYEYVYIKYTSI